MSSRDTDDECLMHSKSETKKLRLMIKLMNLLKNFLNQFFWDVKDIGKNPEAISKLPFI